MNLGEKDKTWTVYLLICPVDKIIRYVGITSRDPQQRLKEHINESKRTNPHKWAWIRSLKNKNLTPKVEILGNNLTESQACEIEKQSIRLYRSNKTNRLTNLHEGGKLPPLLFGEKNPNTNIRKVIIWNEAPDSYIIFDYVSEAANFLNLQPSSLFKVLSGKYKTAKGYYVCYLDEINSWKKPIDRRYKSKTFKIWNEENEWIFENQVDAVNELNLNSVNLSQVLSGKRYKVKNYYACYIDSINKWRVPTPKKGKHHKASKKRRFRVWNDKSEEYEFDYINDAVEFLGLTRRNLQFVLDGGAYSHKGYYACYIDKLYAWEHPKSKTLKMKKILNQPIEVINNNSREKFRYKNIKEATQVLNLHKGHFKNVLFGKLNSHKNYTITFVGCEYIYQKKDDKFVNKSTYDKRKE